MKKIAFILALVMVFAISLVACDEANDASTPVNNESSVSATEDSSTPAEDSSEPAHIDDISPDDGEVSEPADVVEPAAVGENVAVGKTYTTSTLFRMSNVTWGWDETFDVTYPDEDGVSLTDGVKDPGDNTYKNVVWAGFNFSSPDYLENGYSWITVDLGAKTDISKVVLVSATSALGSGIGSDNFAIEFFVSDDGENWTSIGALNAVDSADVNFTETAVETNVSGQYVQVRMSRGGWMFVSEVEVYDVAK